MITLFEVANVNWDYFSPENCEKIRIQNIVPNAKQAKMLRDEIKRTHKEFDEMKAAMDAVTSRTTLSTKEDVRNMAQDKMEQHNANAGDENAIQADITDVNGKMCIVHVVTPIDSLSRLSIMYNVSEKEIK